MFCLTCSDLPAGTHPDLLWSGVILPIPSGSFWTMYQPFALDMMTKVAPLNASGQLIAFERGKLIALERGKAYTATSNSSCRSAIYLGDNHQRQKNRPETGQRVDARVDGHSVRDTGDFPINVNYRPALGAILFQAWTRYFRESSRVLSISSRRMGLEGGGFGR